MSSDRQNESGLKPVNGPAWAGEWFGWSRTGNTGDRVETKRKLLVIEDDVDQRDLVTETLEDHFGPGTVTAVGLLSAALEQKLEQFDLILTDFNLPDATGMEVLGAVQSRCSTPVIMVTGENVGAIAIEAIRKGASDYVVKLGEYVFAIPLIVEKNLASAELRRENERLRGELEKAASTDPLTGLYNRRHFSRVLAQLFSETARTGEPLTCVMIDLDGYKQLNDTHGHQVGDDLLAVAAKCINCNLRAMDVCARYGGDEFIALLPHTDAQHAVHVAERIRAQFMKDQCQLRGMPLGVSMSVGVATTRPGLFSEAEDLIAAADTAMYASKTTGRDRITTAA